MFKSFVASKCLVIKTLIPMSISLGCIACLDSNDQQLIENSPQKESNFATLTGTEMSEVEKDDIENHGIEMNSDENKTDSQNSYGFNETDQSDSIQDKGMPSENQSAEHAHQVVIGIEELQAEAIQLLTLINEQKLLDYAPSDRRALFKIQKKSTLRSPTQFTATSIVLQKDESPIVSTVKSAAPIKSNTSEDLILAENPRPSIDQLKIPDNGRQREALERFSLNQLVYRGMMELEPNKRQGLIERPDGLVVTVEVGNYIGNRNGRITSITPLGIELMEDMVDSSGKHHKNPATLLSKIK